MPFSEILAFLPMAGMIKKAEVVTSPVPKIPCYKKRWFGLRTDYVLDIGPVCWSLRNRPQEWKADEERRVIPATTPPHFVENIATVTHIPSNHSFTIINSRVRLGARCECSGRGQGRGHFNGEEFRRAFFDWKRQTGFVPADKNPALDQQFKAHFVPSTDGE